MPSSIVALQILLFLLPGFLSLTISRSIVTFRSHDVTDRVIHALIFSLVNAALYSILAYGINTARPGTLNPLTAIQLQDKAIRFGDFFAVQNIITVVLVASFSGLVHAASLEKGWLFAFLRKIRVTGKTGKADVWSDTFSYMKGSWVRIRLEDGNLVQGWAKYYSDTSEKMELFLMDVTVYDSTGEVVGGMPGMLITDKTVITTIEFWKDWEEEFIQSAIDSKEAQNEKPEDRS